MAPVAGAVTLNYGADIGVGETDNVTLVPNDKVSQTIAVADVDFSVREQSRLFTGNAKGDFSYLDYLQGAYGSELIGRFEGLGQLSIIPGRVNWTLQDTFGQAQIDPFAAVTPNNQEHVNYLSTGPELRVRVGSTGFLDATGQYARTQYQVSPFDSNRYAATLAVGKQISGTASVSLNASSERTLFDDTLVNTNFDRSSAYGHYEVQGARSEFVANLGVTHVKQGDLSTSGPLAKIDISRQLSAAAKFTLSVGRDLTDGTTSFQGSSGIAGAGITPGIGTISTQGGGGITTVPGGALGTAGTTPAAVTSANYTVTYESASWQYERNRTTIGATVRWEKDAYAAGMDLLDLSRGSLDLNVGRRFTRALSAELLGSIYRTQYAYTDYAETDARVGIALTLNEGRALQFKLRIDHTLRIASGVGSGTGYDENRVFLLVGYRPLTKERST